LRTQRTSSGLVKTRFVPCNDATVSHCPGIFCKKLPTYGDYGIVGGGQRRAGMTDWQTIVGQHGGLVWRTAYRLVGNHADAADCMQEAFIAAVELSRRQAVRNWPGLLARLATTRALDCLRSRLRRHAWQGGQADWAGFADPNPGPPQEAQAAELSCRLRQAMAHLPNDQAEVFCLRFLNELSYREIAGQLGLTKSAVGVLLHRARRRLGELLSPAEVERKSEVLP